MNGWRALDSFPFWCVVSWLAIVLLAPMAAHGDYTEFQQRPFVLVYSSAVVWTVLFVERALPVGASAAALRLGLGTTAAAGIAVAGIAQRDSNPARPQFAWGMRAFNTSLDRGFVEAAAFVRAHAAVGDTVAVIPPDSTTRLDDDATKLSSLAGVPAYLARASIQASNNPARRLVVERRLSELNGIATAGDADAAFEKLRGMGVDFLVTLGDRGPPFDPSGSRAAFRAGRTAVYHIGPGP